MVLNLDKGEISMNKLSYLWGKLFEYETEFFFLCLYVLFRPFNIISDVSSSFGAKFLGCAIIFLMCFLIFEVCFLSSVFYAKVTFYVFSFTIFPLIILGVLMGHITQSFFDKASMLAEGMMLMCILYRTYLRLLVKRRVS